MTSNRHWPNLFKVKPTPPQHQWHETANSSNISSHRTASFEGTSSQEEERNPEPKPRWNPKPEQIRILETIFNSGMVNPPRDEIQRIRFQLQEYGEVGDANVFYWFQNRKSRTKQKQRHLQTATDKAKSSATAERFPSSFDQYNIANSRTPNFTDNIRELSCSTLPPSASFPLQYLGHQQHQQMEAISADHYINMQAAAGAGVGARGGILDESICAGHTNGMPSMPQAYSTFLLNEAQSYPFFLDHIHAAEAFKSQQNLISSSLIDSTIIHAGTDTMVNSSNGSLLTVFIDNVAYEVPSGPINVKAVFGEHMVLVDSSCQPVLVDDHGFTLQGLQQGAMYYLVKM